MNKFKSYSQYLNEQAEVESKKEKEEKVEETVSSMLEKVYESCKNEAKVYEDDAHDSHTVESYMSENAALIATLAVGALKEMKEEYSTEAFEAACNKMVESYTDKITELKESELSGDAIDVAESVRRGSYPAFSVDMKTYKIQQWYADNDIEADSICWPIKQDGKLSFCYESGHNERSVKGIADQVVKMLKSKKDQNDIEEYISEQENY
jgi:hypothetical protein